MNNQSELFEEIDSLNDTVFKFCKSNRLPLKPLLKLIAIIRDKVQRETKKKVVKECYAVIIDVYALLMDESCQLPQSEVYNFSELVANRFSAIGCMTVAELKDLGVKVEC